MLPVDLMKTLLVIITRSKRPIKITSGYIVTLSNESFMKVNGIINCNDIDNTENIFNKSDTILQGICNVCSHPLHFRNGSFKIFKLTSQFP